MISHHPANVDGHKYCGSWDMMLYFYFFNNNIYKWQKIKSKKGNLREQNNTISKI